MEREERADVVRLMDVLRVEGPALAKEVVALPRAATISDEDATQFMHAILAALVETVEGRSFSAREVFLDGMRSFSATGRPVADGVRGVSRYCLLIAGRVTVALPVDERPKAQLRLATAASELLHDIVALEFEARDRSSAFGGARAS